MKITRIWLYGFLVVGLSGCGSAPTIDWQALSERFSSQEAFIASERIGNIEATRERQAIIESPALDGVAQRIEKEKTISAHKQQQQATIEPLMRRLRAMSEQGVLDTLGAPTRQIRQGSIAIWQYVVAQCQWDLYFRHDTAARASTLHDLIVHHRGNIITDATQIAGCEIDLLSRQQA